MNFVFWLALIIGGGLLLLSLAGSDSAGDGDMPAGEGGDWGRLMSIRNATYFLFAFGATGVLLQLMWGGSRPVLAAIIAAFTGFLAWAISGLAFGYLRRTDAGHMHGDRWLVGRTGEVTLPLSATSTGKIMVTRAGQTQELLARPHNEDDPEPETWSSVMVVEVRDGIALVTPSPVSAESEATTGEADAST